MHEKKSATFLARLSTGAIHRRHLVACGKEVRAGSRPWLFPRYRTGRPIVHRHAEALEQAAPNGPPSPWKQPVRGRGAGYHSPVRSNTGDEIGRIAQAIDQLESDARNGTDEAEMTTRIAVLWQMVSALDPELARRAQQYAAPPGGTPSA